MLCYVFDTDYLLFGFCAICLNCLVTEIDNIMFTVDKEKYLVLDCVFLLLVLVCLDDGCISVFLDALISLLFNLPGVP